MRRRAGRKGCSRRATTSDVEVGVAEPLTSLMFRSSDTLALWIISARSKPCDHHGSQFPWSSVYNSFVQECWWGGAIVGFLHLPGYLLIPLVLASVACEDPSSTPAPTPDTGATVPAAIGGALPTPTFTPAPDFEATVIAAVRATVTALPAPTPTIAPTSTPVLSSTVTPAPTATQTPNSQFETVCASGEKLVRIHEFGVIPGNLIDEFEAISKICGFTWCNPRYCDYVHPSE